MINFKWFWINKNFIIKTSWQLVGSIYAIIGLAGMLANLDELILPEFDAWKRILIGIAILFILWLVVFIGCCFYYYRTDKICVLNLSNNHHVYIQYGDIFDKSIICDKNKNPTAEIRNIIIPVNCCFDTVVDNDLVSSQKIHGKAFCGLYGTKRYTPQSLYKTIINNLHSRNIPFVNISVKEKPKGNLKRYPFGTVAEIKVSDEQKFFLLALTEFDNDLHAEIHNRENYMLVLQRLIEYISSRSQGFPTILPLIGGGLPEVCESEQIVLELILDIIKINKNKINCDIHIVVGNNSKKDISILRLKQGDII